MKKIIINEHSEKVIYNFMESENLSSHLKKALAKNKTSLGKHPSFPPDEEDSFDKKITLKRFNEIKKTLNDIDGLNDFSEESVAALLSKLIKECQEKEKPIRENLEKICANTLVKFFNVPSDLIIYSCKLTDNVESKSRALRLTPESVEDIEFEDILQMQNMSDEVYKRRLIDALIMGASMNFSATASKECIGDIFELNPKLPELYSNIIKLNNLLMFIKNDIKISDKNPMQGGIVNVTLGNSQTKTKIEVEAMIFPILLSESIKGFMELFASYGLPKRKDMALYVTKKADFLLAEPWDMRLGPVLWQYFMDSIGMVDNELLPSIFTTVIELPTDKFFKLMQEVFAKTKKGKEVMSLIVNKVKHDIEYGNFEDKLNAKRDEIISAENDYISPDELLN